MLVVASSAAVNLAARHASNLELTLMVTRPCAVLPLVSVTVSRARYVPGERKVFHRVRVGRDSPSSKVHCASRSGAVPGTALAAKLTVSGIGPLVVLAEGAQAGPPAPLFSKARESSVGSVLKNATIGWRLYKRPCCWDG